MDLETRVAKLKAEVERRAQAGTRGRFTDAMRTEALALLRALVAQGATQEEVGTRLGMSSWTLSRWHQRERQGLPLAAAAAAPQEGASEPGGVFRAVQVRSEPALRSSTGLTVHGPAGLRVEGLGVADVAALLRALA